MTDKTSTAPVMTLKNVCDALHEAHNSPGFEALLDSCVAAIDAHLNAPTPDVVGGDVVACRYRVVAPNGNVGKWFFTDEACVSSECLEVQPLYAAPRIQGEIIAWVTPDGDRSLTAAQKAGMEADGGAGETSVRPFSVPAYAGGLRVQGDADHSDAIELLRAYQSHFGSIKPDDADEASVWERIEKACRQLAAQPKGDVVVGSWPWLRGVLSGMPSREEVLGGQRHRYLSRDEVLGWIDDGERRAAIAHPAEQTKSQHADELSRILAYADDIKARDERSAAAYCKAEYDALMARKPEQAVGDGVAAHRWIQEDGTPGPWIDGDVREGHEVAHIERQGFALERSYRAPRQAVPDGWQLVPVGPSRQMLDAYNDTLVTAGQMGPGASEKAYAAMLAAAPSAGRMGVDE